MNIAIDGPAGAGKSTIAKALARELSFLYVDTGALYRAVGYAMTQMGVELQDPQAVEAALAGLRVSLRYVAGAQRVFVGEEDVSDRIRTPEMSMAASTVSAQPAVRQFLFQLQRDIAAENDVIMDGRDIGTVVLPQAELKVFLTASAEERARRRHLELLEKGEAVTFDEVFADMVKRDEADRNRAIAPLRQAEDAVPVDTSGLTLEESIALLRRLVEERLPG